jgi:hypothetical protein
MKKEKRTLSVLIIGGLIPVITIFLFSFYAHYKVGKIKQKNIIKSITKN